MSKPDRAEAKGETTASVLGDIALKGALSLLPGGSVLHDLLKARRDELKEAIAREQDRRLDEFYAEMLHGQSAMDDQVARAMVDQADFHALLRACVADMEAEKVRIYANMARSIATGSVASGHRRHFVLSVRDLSYEEVSLLRSAYVVRRHTDVMPSHGAGSLSQGDFLRSDQSSAFRQIHVSNLGVRGFIREAELTPLGTSFVEAIWRIDDLTPASLGLTEWIPRHVIILNYEIGEGGQDQIADRLASALRQRRIRSSIIALVRSRPGHNAIAPLRYNTFGVLLVGSLQSRLSEHLVSIQEFARKTPMVAVRTVEAAETPSAVPLLDVMDAMNLGAEQIADRILIHLAATQSR